MIENYNRTANALPPLSLGSTVLIHDGKGRRRWNRIGTVVAVNQRKYTLRMHGSGRVVTRNRRFIKKTGAVPDNSMLMHSPLPPSNSMPLNNASPAGSMLPIAQEPPEHPIPDTEMHDGMD